MSPSHDSKPHRDAPSGQRSRGKSHRGRGRTQRPRKPRPDPDEADRGGVYQDREGRPELKIYGVAACQMLFDERPDTILRAYISERIARRFGMLMKFLAAQRRPYRIIEDDELQRVSGTRHHEGVCVVVRPEVLPTVSEYLRSISDLEGPICVLGLEGVGNPHNLGAITRVAAQFGVSAILSDCASALQNGAAARNAQGGIEFVQPVSCEDPLLAVDAFRRKGFTLFTTSSHEGEDVFEVDLPERSLVYFGDEGLGLSGEMLHAADRTLRIPGSGFVESLNVACATSIILGQYWRNHGAALLEEFGDVADSGDPD